MAHSADAHALCKYGVSAWTSVAEQTLSAWLAPTPGTAWLSGGPCQWHWGDVLGLEKSPLHTLLLKRETEEGGPGLRYKGVAMVTSEESNSSRLRADGRVRQLAP